jgi:cyanophycin synthetase
MAAPDAVSLVELRVLDGPNLYFTRPAIKLTLAVPGWLGATEEKVAHRAEALGVPVRPRTRPGPPGSEQRRRFVARLAARVTRALAATTHTDLAVRGRSGSELDQIVIAYPWRRRTAAEAFGREVAALVGAAFDGRRTLDALVRAAAKRLSTVEPGPTPTCPEPKIPVIAVTGTNGKTTSVRLLAHLVQAAGKTVAYSSTDGVYLNDDLVEAGDYSGFGGAAKAMSQPGVEVAVLETARGGILLRGMGAMHNDVAVVTNVSADHLGLQGIRTLDQLAEVKASILRVTRSEGWAVLNADDPRVLAMRKVARGRPWICSLDPDHPALRTALDERGRGMTVLDGHLTLLEPGRDPRGLIALEDVPVTLSGISPNNIQNAMGAAAAALGIGLPHEAVVEGLRTFLLDPERNPGRTNLFELDGRIVVVDYAHNEAGIKGLTDVVQGLRRRGASTRLAIASAGDRSDEIMHGMGYLAARGADQVVISELLRYLRGRERKEVVRRLRKGAEDGGATDVPVFRDELHSLAWMVERSQPEDVVAITALGQRPEVFVWLKDRGAEQVGPKRLRQLVRRARGRSRRRTP